MQDFTDRSAVITGAAGGMGRAIALRLAREGVAVAVVDIDAEAAEAVASEARELGVKAISVRTDVSSFDDVQRLADTAYDTFGKVDILVNNAGVTMRPFRASWDASYEDYQWVMNINWYGVLHGHLAFVPRMREQGRDAHIVNTSSAASFMIIPGHTAYLAAKAAVDAFSMATRREFELAGVPIGLSVLFPGGVRTRISTSERLRPNDQQSDTRSVKPWSDYVGEQAALSGAEATKGQLPNGEATDPFQIIDPDIVGDIVLHGIRNNFEFITTHPTPADIIHDRANRLVAGYHGLG